MKFELNEERQTELAALVTQLDSWVRELEEMDLAAYDPVLVTAAAAGEDDAGDD